MVEKTSRTEYRERTSLGGLNRGEPNSPPGPGALQVAPPDEEGFWPGYPATLTFVLITAGTFFSFAMQDDPALQNSWSKGIVITFICLNGLLSVPHRRFRRLVGGLAYGLMVGMIVGRFLI
jgi:hypothetical protein